jgi:osmotically-inducible protein OsmY
MGFAMTKFPLTLVLLSSAALLSGCGAAGLAAGAGAVTGIAAAKEGGLQSSIVDEAVRLKISDLWFKKDVDMFSKLNLTVNQGRVLITGVVQNPEDRVEAVRLAWQPKGVKQVINEIRVGKAGNIGNYAQDSWISSQIRGKMIFHRDIQSINYSIDAVQGSVYLMGVAQNQEELNRVVRLCQSIKGVKEVISYVKLSGEPSGSTASATSAPGMVPSSAPMDSAAGAPMDIGPSYSDPAYPASDMAPAPAPDSSYTPSYSTPTSSPSGIESEVLPP